MATAIRAYDFVNSIGVNVHVEYTDGKYADAATVVKDLAYIGVTHVRDASLNPANEGQASYDVLANAGVKFDMIMMGTPIDSSLSLLDGFVAAHRGAISSIEGPNEVNNWPITYNGQTGNDGAIAYQNALYQAVKADPALGALPVLNLTNDTSLAAASDYNNVHAYPFAGAQPYATLLDALKTQTAALPNEAAYLTEAGYYTLPNGVGWGGVDYAAQAKLTLNLLMDATKLGFKQVFLYQLLDAYADPTASDPEKHFGLFDVANIAKPVAVALHNLTILLGDGASGASSFQPGSIDYTLTGAPSTASTLLIEKSSGVYDLVIWNEPTIWDNNSHTAIAASSSNVTVAFNAAFGNVSVFDPMVGTLPQFSLTNASQVTVAITDHPVIIELGAAAGRPLLTAKPGGDTVTGGSAAEEIYGGLGSDSLQGGGGADTLHAGGGLDTLGGGRGADLFVFSDLQHTGVDYGGDVLSDFRPSEYDLIDLRGLEAALPANAALHFIGNVGFSHTAGEVRWAREYQGVALSGDVNGDGAADFCLHLKGLTSLPAGSLLL